MIGLSKWSLDALSGDNVETEDAHLILYSRTLLLLLLGVL